MTSEELRVCSAFSHKLTATIPKKKPFVLEIGDELIKKPVCDVRTGQIAAADTSVKKAFTNVSRR